MTLTAEHSLDAPRPHRFTREEYYQMADAGLFQGKRVELIDGEILEKFSPIDPPPAMRFTREEYYRMAEAGVFQDKRVELIEGEIIDMAPQKNSHVLGISRAVRALSKAFGDNYWIRSQAPLHLGERSEPEPDVAVVMGPMESYEDHPKTALLVVEVSDTSLRYDRREKASLYARAGIADYWIVNLIDNRVEVMREPVEELGAALGWRYKSVTIARGGESVLPLARPSQQIAVVDLLP